MYTSPTTYFQRLIYFFIFLVAVKTYPYCSPQDGDDSMYFSHKEDCNSFWKCSNGQPHLFKCPPTLHFNSELNVCDYPQNVGCITSTEDSTKTTATENTFFSTTEQPSTTTTTQKISTTNSTKPVPICPARSSTRTFPTYITQKTTTPSMTVEILSTTTADTTPTTSTTSSTTIEINSSDTTVLIVISTTNVSLVTSETSMEADTEHVTKEIISTISDVTNTQTDTEDSTEHKFTSTTNIVDLSSTTDVDSSVSTNTPDETFKISSTSLTTVSSPEDIITNSITTTTENMDYLCEPSSEYFFTAHPNSCYSYIACSFGTAHVLTCYDNKWFNSFTSTCVKPVNSDCNRSRLIPININTETESNLAPIDSLDFICDNETNETYKYHPFDCEKFVVCDHGYPVVMNCPKGLHFDLSLKQCVYSYESKCSLTS